MLLVNLGSPLLTTCVYIHCAQTGMMSPLLASHSTYQLAMNGILFVHTQIR